MGKRYTPSAEFQAATFVSTATQRTKEETLFDALYRKYPAYAENFSDRFLCATGEKLEWGNINLPNLDKFIQYLRACNLSDNSINQYGHKLMATLNLYSALHPEMPTKEELSSVLDTPLDESYEVALDEDDVDALYAHLNKLLKSEHTHKKYSKCDQVAYDIEVLSHFLLSVDTGARSFDEKGITWDNITEGFDTEGMPIYILTYTTNKKGIKATLPIAVDSRLVPLLRNIMPLTVGHRECNRRIKNICRDAGLTQLIKRRRAGRDEVIELCDAVHFHLARKSYVTNTLKMGAAVTDVMQFVGHTNPQQTMHYNCAGPTFESKVVYGQRKRDDNNSVFSD